MLNELKDVEGETVKFDAIRSSHRLDTKTTTARDDQMAGWAWILLRLLQELGLQGKSTGDLNQFGDKLINNI